MTDFEEEKQEPLQPFSISLDEFQINIQTLFDKYESNEYMLNRLKHHIMHILPATLENECKNHEKRIIRNQFLSTEQQIFIQVFLSQNKYYYLPSNNCFYHYDGIHYNSIKEDDIHYQLLSTISKDRTLMEWKYKTKINIIKQIKERNLFKCTPESDTIQKVLNVLYPSLLSTRSQVKYFLTILGDAILKKHNDLLFLIKPKTKSYLVELDTIAYICLGFNNITSNFMTKFHENYNYDKCRLIQLQDTLTMEDWTKTLKTMGLDILCVAAHYSNRYGNSDAYLANQADDPLKNYVLFLKNSNEQEILNHFCKYSITELSIPIDSDSDWTGPIPSECIHWKNMHFIWKTYISAFSLPNVFYMQHLKSLLRERYPYDEETDSFLYITSKYLPNVSHFISFWEENVTEVVSDPAKDQEIDNEFETDELCLLFKSWIKEETQMQTYLNHKNVSNINENDVLKMIHHFFQHIVIIENKYILNIQCKLWSKTADVNNALEMFRQEYPHSKTSLIHFDEIYDFYCSKERKYVVSKRYFEKYMYVFYSDFIEYEKFISPAFFDCVN